MASEQFSLCWDNFHKNMSSGMNSLLENEDLVDVTLAVQGRCLKAHKMVLSVCSPYFKELFKSNPCKHPIVFMKDVSFDAMSDLLQFMYQGEVQVSQENLTTFIKTAEALQIKGLTGDGNGSADAEVAEPVNEKPHVEEYRPTPRPKKQQSSNINASPAVKRPRLSTSEPQAAVTKSEPVGPSQSDTSAVQFKMEPYDQSTSLIDDTGDDNFGDDNLDDTANDDNEDYSMMESSMTGEEEPQAGTSTDGTGEGQEHVIYKLVDGRRIRLVMDRYEFRCDRTRDIGNGTIRRVWCCMSKKTKCSARICTFNDEKIVELRNVGHNHLPRFIKDLSSYQLQKVSVRYLENTKKGGGKQEVVKRTEPTKNSELFHQRAIKKDGNSLLGSGKLLVNELKAMKSNVGSSEKDNIKFIQNIRIIPKNT